MVVAVLDTPDVAELFHTLDVLLLQVHAVHDNTECRNIGECGPHNAPQHVLATTNEPTKSATTKLNWSSPAVLLELHRVTRFGLHAGIGGPAARVVHRHDEMPFRMAGRRSAGQLAELRADASPVLMHRVQHQSLRVDDLHGVVAPQRDPHARLPDLPALSDYLPIVLVIRNS